VLVFPGKGESENVYIF